jgi:3-hydroxymyristoyl/3-hydroxydecanoyl-(acyl carrier protein) dehydratase
MNHATIAFAADHPTGAGHFPGNPIIPGALLLSHALRAIADKTDMICDVRSAKFLHPVRPGQSVSIAWEQSPNGAISFTGEIEDGIRVISGLVAFGDSLC